MYEYEDDYFPRLEAAFENVVSLRKFFSKNLKVPADNIVSFLGEEKPENIIQYFGEAQKRGEINTILFYYSGHGLMGEEMKEYYLALKQTKPSSDLAYTALSIKNLSRRLKDTKKRVILIIDACFSANAFSAFNTKDFLILASSKASETSQYPLEEEYSAFTGNLLDILRNGINEPLAELNFRHIYDALVKRMNVQGFPIPQIADQHNVSATILMANPWNSEEKQVDQKALQQLEVLYDALYLKDTSIKTKRIEAAGSANFGSKLKEIILGQFPFFISYHLKNMLPDQDFIDLRYLQKYYRYLIQFLGLIAIADISKNASNTNGELKKILARMPSANHDFYLDCLQLIGKIQPNLLFIPEFSNVGAKEMTLEISIQKMEKLLKETTDKEVFKEGLITFLTQLAFLSDYQFVSTRQIFANKGLAGYQMYRHQISSLHGEMPHSYRSLFEFSDSFLYNSAVLLFRAKKLEDIEEHTPYFSLWPLVIDANGFEVKGDKPEIYYYAKQDTKNQFLYNSAHLEEIREAQPYQHFHKNISVELLDKFFADFKQRLL